MESEDEIVMAKGDSAASHHYWREEDIKVMSEITKNPRPSILLPNNSSIDVTNQGQLLLLEKLSPRARNAMVLFGLKIACLVSIGQLYDDSFDVFLNNHKLIAMKENHIILEGIRYYSDEL